VRASKTNPEVRTRSGGKERENDREEMAVLKIIHFIDSASGTCKPYPLYSSQAEK